MIYEPLIIRYGGFYFLAMLGKCSEGGVMQVPRGRLQLHLSVRINLTIQTFLSSLEIPVIIAGT